MADEHRNEEDAANLGTSQPGNSVQTPTSTGGIKLWSILSGAAHNCNEDFTDTLKDRIQDLNEVYTSNESNTDLVFCPVESEAATDIENALKKFTDCSASSLKVLVVLHNKFDPEKTIQDSSRCVKRTDILTVDCLYDKDTGLLECQKNYDAMDKVVNWLIQQAKEKYVSKYSCQKFNKTTRYRKEAEALKKQNEELKKKKKSLEEEIVELTSMNKQLSDKQSLLENSAKYQTEEQETQGKQQPMFPGAVNLFSMFTGKTNNSHKRFIDTLINHIQDLREVHTVDKSHIVLVFCPIVSRAGTDIDTALKKFTDSTASKLKVLVVLHHTFDPEKTVPDSSRCVNREDILTVDCLFYEDTGLLECQKNHEAMDKVVSWLIQQGKVKPGVNIYPRQNGSNGKILSTITSRLPKWPWVSLSDDTEQMRSTKVKISTKFTQETEKFSSDFLVRLKIEFEGINHLEATKEKKSDVILNFYAVHNEKDYDAVLKKLTEIKEKLAVFIILHVTEDSHSVPDSSKHVNSPFVFVVDCIFCDGEGPDCQINRNAVTEVSKWLNAKFGHRIEGDSV